MKTLTTVIHRVTQANETLFILLEEESPEDFEHHHFRDRSLPLRLRFAGLD